MIEEVLTKKGEFIILIKIIKGSGWSNDVEKIIKKVIKPESFERKNIEMGWDYSEIEFNVKKDNVNFVLHIDDEGPTYMELLTFISEDNKHKLREWASIIDSEVEKLK